MDGKEYTATYGLLQLLRYQANYPALGTGAAILSAQATNLLGGVPDTLKDYTQSVQNNLFGDYPTKSDMAPCVVFATMFGLLMVAHIIIFLINCSRGHYFFLTLGWVFYCMMRIVGFVLRIYWGRNILLVKMGIADEVFLILPTILLASINLILAQRIFTWRHPVGGSLPIFWNTMIALYIIVCGVIAMTIVTSSIPTLYLLSEKANNNYHKAVQCTSVLILLYSLTAISLLLLAYFFKPTAKDEKLYTYQPWWIESFHPLYFVKPNAAINAAETFVKRNHNHRHSIRVIASTFHHHNMVEGLSRDRGDVKHNMSLFIIIVTTFLITVLAICRLIVTFQPRPNTHKGKLCSNIALYICWGLFEVIIMVLYIVGRVDLRFYRPDRLPKHVREIITAEQTGVNTAEPSIYNSAEYTDIETPSLEKLPYPLDDHNSFSQHPRDITYPTEGPDRHHSTAKDDDNSSEFNF